MPAASISKQNCSSLSEVQNSLNPTRGPRYTLRMKNIFLFLIIALSFGCVSKAPVDAAPAAPKNYFPDMKGCFLLYNVKTQTYEKVINQENCREQIVACSTFKVPLAVMAFDSKILKDENEVLKWDGKKEEREALNQDHDAKTWMRDSVVWFSQRLTPKIGMKKLKKYLSNFNYGNQDMSGGLKTAWLTAPDKEPALKISAYEQKDFMEKLWTDKLPVTPRAMKLTREITFLETSPKGFRLSGKTGSNYFAADRLKRLGWFISHLQKDDQEYIAITNFIDTKPGVGASYGGPKAKEITKLVLSDLGLW